MLELIALWTAAALAVCAWNIYTQLILADNWPPSSWKRISWDAVALLLAVCLAAWPLVVALALHDHMGQKTMMRITGTDTPAGKAMEQAYMLANASSPCPSCDAIGRVFSTCQCGSQFLPVKKPVLMHLPLWS